jgi:hypothetical protein
MTGGNIEAGSMTVSGELTHPVTDDKSKTINVCVSGKLTVADTGSINADKKSTRTAVANRFGGVCSIKAYYGGYGGLAGGSGCYNSVGYGSSSDPVDLGTRGSTSDRCKNNMAGGVIRIHAGDLDLKPKGTISAKGIGCSSGGSVNVKITDGGEVTGSGVIDASAITGGGRMEKSGGGRISLTGYSSVAETIISAATADGYNDAPQMGAVADSVLHGTLFFEPVSGTQYAWEGCSTLTPHSTAGPSTTEAATTTAAPTTTVTATGTTTTTATATTETATITTTTTVNYCTPGADADNDDDCVQIPDLAEDAVINTNYKLSGGATITVPAHKNNHKTDGKFGDDEWEHVTPAVGRFTNAYIDYSDGYLHILNDWIYNPSRPVQPDCYNLFFAFTGSGQQQWVIRVYGSGLVEVELNGKQLDASEAGGTATGAIGFGSSPLRDENHTIFELSFEAMAGGFGVQLHDPGPRFGCNVLETEIVNFVGNADAGGGGTVDAVDADEFGVRSATAYYTTAEATSITAGTTTEDRVGTHSTTAEELPPSTAPVMGKTTSSKTLTTSRAPATLGGTAEKPSPSTAPIMGKTTLSSGSTSATPGVFCDDDACSGDIGKSNGCADAAKGYWNKYASDAERAAGATFMGCQGFGECWGKVCGSRECRYRSRGSAVPRGLPAVCLRAQPTSITTQATRPTSEVPGTTEHTDTTTQAGTTDTTITRTRIALGAGISSTATTATTAGIIPPVHRTDAVLIGTILSLLVVALLAACVAWFAGKRRGKKAAPQYPAFINPVYDAAVKGNDVTPQDKHNVLQLEGGDDGTVSI